MTDTLVGGGAQTVQDGPADRSGGALLTNPAHPDQTSTGDLVVHGMLEVTGDTQLDGGLAVQGTSTLNGAVTLGAGINFTNPSDLTMAGGNLKGVKEVETEGLRVQTPAAVAFGGSLALQLTDYFARWNTNAAPCNAGIPAAGTCGGKIFEIRKDNASANALTIVPTAGTINGAANLVVANNTCVRIVSDGVSNWIVMGITN